MAEHDADDANADCPAGAAEGSSKECSKRGPVKREPQAKALPEREDIWAKEHYCFQVAFINEVVKSPWRRCFGSLGTGFVGVRPADAASPVKSEPRPNGGTSPPVAKAEGGHSTSHSSSDCAVPSDATVCIFINAPAKALQQRGGRTIDGYKDALDRHERTLEWSAQRSDNKNKRIEAIIAHCDRGGRVVVGVRPPSKRQFRLLGEVSHIDALHRARFLVEHGDHVIQERGTRTFHKTITVACLNMGLRSGVGLSVARYPMEGKARWCSSCCYAPPKAVLHFRELRDEGVTAYHTKVGKRDRQAKLEEAKLEEAKLEVDSPTESRPIPLKRLRCKQSLTKEEFPSSVFIKTEPVDQEETPSSVCIKTRPEDQEETPSSMFIKTRPEDQEETPSSMFIETGPEHQEKAALVQQKVIIKTELLKEGDEEHVSTPYLATFGFQLLNAA